LIFSLSLAGAVQSEEALAAKFAALLPHLDEQHLGQLAKGGVINQRIALEIKLIGGHLT
jgi:hypothetical protein